MLFPLLELLAISSLIFSLVLLRIFWESLEMVAGSSCILDERAKEAEYLTKVPLVPGARQAVELKKYF